MGSVESGETCWILLDISFEHHSQRSIMTLDITPPPALSQPLNVPLKTMTGPGPSNVNDRVLQAQALPTLGHLHPEFTKIMDDIKAGVQYIFQTSNPMTLALSATGHAAMECVMTNMLEPGRTVLIANNGISGIRSAVRRLLEFPPALLPSHSVPEQWRPSSPGPDLPAPST